MRAKTLPMEPIPEGGDGRLVKALERLALERLEVEPKFRHLIRRWAIMEVMALELGFNGITNPSDKSAAKFKSEQRVTSLLAQKVLWEFHIPERVRK